MVLKRLFGSNAVAKEKFREMQENHRLQEMLEQRQKSANERELEVRMEKQRQIAIQAELVRLRKIEQQENMQTTVLKSDFNVLDNGNPILKQKNLFAVKQNNQGGGMFFK